MLPKQYWSPAYQMLLYLEATCRLRRLDFQPPRTEMHLLTQLSLPAEESNMKEGREGGKGEEEKGEPN